MPSHQSYDVRHRLVRFDSQRLQHKNAPHTGTRYAIVMFNKDLNYAGSTEDARSNRIKAEPPVRLSVVPTFPADQAAFLEVLDATRFPQDRSTSGKPHSKYGETRGTFLSFGETQSRKSRADRHFQGLDTRRSDSQNNTKYATLYQAFLTYMEVFAPGEFGGTYTSCIIAKNSKCEWHCDTGNIGHASITALGPYEGGELLVESEKDDYIIAIPSYHRLKCFQTRTYKRIIQKYGLCHKVHLYLQNPEDVAEYGAAFPDLTIHESPPGLLATMNHIGHDWPIGKRVVVMHDDLTRVHGLDADGKRANVDDLDALFISTFARLDALNLNLAGLYPQSDPRKMAQAPEETTDLRFIHDPLHLVRNQRVPLLLAPKQDFERTIEYYKRDGGVLRLNRFAFGTSYNPKTQGGYGHRTREDEAAATQLFLSVYKDYVKRVIVHKSGSTSLVLRRVS